MRFLISICFILILAIISHSGIASPIPGPELFLSSNDFSYKLNPSSKYTAHHFFRSDGRDIIELVDIKKNKKGDIFRLVVEEHGKIDDYFWIDEETIYVSYRIGENKYKRVFIDIDFNKFESGDQDYTSSREIKVEGYIIDPLKDQGNVFLFQRVHANTAQVFKLTTEQLISNDFAYANRVRPSLSDAVAYFTDGNGEVRFGFNVDKEAIVYWYLDKQENEWIEIHRYTGDDAYFKPVGLIGNNKLAVISNAETDLRVLMAYDLTTKKFGEILYQHDKYDIFSAQTSAENLKVSSVSYSEHGRLMSHYFTNEDVEINTSLINLLPGKQFFTVSQNKGSTIRIIVSFASDDSGRFYWFDSGSRELIPLNALYRNHDKFKFTRTELLTVKNSQGHSIEAFLTRPENGNGVLIVNPHGGPIGIRDDDDFNPSSQYFASRGYSILSVNFRGSAGLGKDFMDAGRGQFGKIIESDITSVVNQVKNKYKYTQTCSMGASYGGYSALVLVAQNPKDYDCAISQYGIYDLPLLFNRSNVKMNKKYIDSISKVIGEQKDLTKDQSPVNFVEKINVPVLLIAGLDDDISGFEQSNRMKYRLNQFNKDVDTMFYAETGHGFHSKWHWDSHEHAYIDDFIRNKLNIKHPESKEWNKAIADDAMIISDGFEFKNKVKIDRKKAFRYAEIAAAQDSPRAVHNLAAYYNGTDAVEKDIDKALELYARASKLGWVKSSDYLGEVYRDGIVATKDLKKSLQYFEAADKQGSKDAWFYILRAKCSGWGTDRDIDYCVEGLITSDEKKNNLSVKQERLLLEDIILKPWPSEVFRKIILSQLSKINIFNIDNKNDFVAGSIDPHVREKQSTTIDNNKLYWEKKGRRVQLKYFIKGDNFNKRSNIALKVHWIVSNKDNKEILLSSENIIFPEAGKDRTFELDVKDKIFEVKGVIELIVKNLDEVILHSETIDFDLENDS